MNATVEVSATATANCQCKPEWEKLCNFGPGVPQALLRVSEDRLLLHAPRPLLDAWVEVIEPTLAALFAVAVRDVRGDGSPLDLAVRSRV